MDEYCKNFHRIAGSFPIVEFSALIYLTDPQGNLLLVQDNDDLYWRLPGGMIRPDEKVVECLRRTVFNQIGVYIENAVFLNIFSGRNQNYISIDGANITPVYAAYLPTKVRGVLKRAAETDSEIRFFATWNVHPEKIFPPMVDTVRFFLENFPGGVPLKPLDLDRFSEEF
ncbi:MAG: NUDIX domain-containing protein [Flexilinea sp.]